MFKQRNMTRKLKQRLGRAISIVMSAAMLVTALPADLLGGIASVNAEPGAGTATVLNVSDMTKGKVSAGAMNGSVFSAKDDSMTVVEDTQTFDGEDLTQSLKMTADSVITFDAAKGDKLTVYAMTDNGEDGGSADKADAGDKTVEGATKLTVTGEEKGSGDDRAHDTKTMNLTGTLAAETLELTVDGSYTLTVDGAAKVFYLELTAAEQPDENFMVKRYVLDASTTPNDVDENGAAVDNVEIADGTKLGTEDYFTVVLGETADDEKAAGTVKKRKGTEYLKAYQIEKKLSASVNFTVKGTADVELLVSSTGGTNYSPVALRDAAGKYIAASSATGTSLVDKQDGTYVVYGNEKAPSTLVFKGLPAGTYSVVSPVSADYNRGAWLIKATVDDKVPVMVKSYVLDASTTPNDVDESGAPVDNVEIADGTKLGTEDYFTVVLGETADDEKAAGTVKKRKGTEYLKAYQIEKKLSASVNFTVKGTADVELLVSSTGGTNYSPVALRDAAGKYIAASSATGTNLVDKQDGTYVVYGNEKAPSTLVFKGLPAGTYSVVSPVSADYNRGAWLIKATVDEKVPVMVKNYVLDASTTPNDVDENGAPVDNVEIADGTKLGTEGYFTVVLGETADDEKAAGTVKKRKGTEYLKAYQIEKKLSASVNFTVKGTADVELLVSSTGGTNYSPVALRDAAGKYIVASSATGTNLVDKQDGTYVVYGNEKAPSTLVFKGLTAGTYSVVSPVSADYNRGAWLIKASVTDTFADSGEPEKPEEITPWEEVAAPEIVSVVLNEKNSSKITVTVKALIGAVGGDRVEVEMMDATGDVVEKLEDSIRSKYDEKTEQYQSEKIFNFTPQKSGSYTFIARLVREGEESKVTAETEAFAFKLPLSAPAIKSVTNKGTAANGKGILEIAWEKVPEANSYEVTVTTVKNAAGDTSEEVKKNAKKVTTEDRKTLVDGLEVGSEVEVAVVAVRKSDNSKSAAGIQKAIVNGQIERTWAFTAYGASTSLANNGYERKADGSVKVWSRNGSGKIVPATTDGLAFYYTTIDPVRENFTMTADVHVDTWTYSNGQDGFGMMVSDTVGESGNASDFWTNSYQLISTKIEYRWDPEANDGKGGVTTKDVVDPIRRYSMRQGLGWIAKTGATALDVANINAGKATAPVSFSSSNGTLETSAGLAGLAGGDYNMVGNIKNPSDKIPTYGTQLLPNLQPLTDFKMQIQRNNTGYILRYLSAEKDAEGKYVVLAEQTFYDYDRNVLTQIDKNNIYVGFFAARNADITVSNIELTTIDPDEDEPAKEREKTIVESNYTISSPLYSNSSYYELIFSGNQDGKLTILGENDKVIAMDAEVTAGKKRAFGTHLNKGANTFNFIFVPDPDYAPGEFQVMDNHDTWTQTFVVTYQELEGDAIYVAPDGKSDNAGTEASPLDIYTAVNYAHEGQTIYLAGGKYELKDLLLVGKGHDGTEKQPITMKAKDPANRPVLDFTQQTEKGSAFTIAGDYWHLKDFDVTNSKASEKGIQVSGDYNLLENLHTYRNGNTGIQIARYGSDSRADWPTYNTVLNCTSYMNADPGYEDADGFAAKLTIGEGNRFVGCIAAYNADDGWDFFAKRETGSIGAVTIENCLAFKNGYVLGTRTEVDGKVVDVLDLNSRNELTAGNGNGFKMGGDSLPGHHVLINSVAFGNRAKGIDSNSCPDIQVYNSTSFNNEGYNVAFYTNNAAISTDYDAQGVLSYRTKGATVDDNGAKGDQLKLQKQKEAKVYGESNFYFNGSSYANIAGAKAEDNWFVSTDMMKAIFGDANGAGQISRKADGSIDMHGFLELTDKAPEGVGARLGSTSYEDIIVNNKPIELNVIAATVTKLSEVKLPEGYTWAYPDTLTAVFAGTKSEFIAKDAAGVERAAVVNFIDVTGVELTADKESLIGEETLRLTAKPVTAPVVDDAEFASAQGSITIDYDIKETSKLKLSVAAVEGQKNAKDIKRAADSGEGLAKITAAMSVKIGNKTVKKQAVYSFTTRKTPFEFTYTATGEGVTQNEDGSITVASNVTSFTFTELKVTGVAGGEGVKTASNDTKVIKVSGTTVTVAGEGTATITLTAEKDKTVIQTVPVTVRGRELKTNVSTITVDIAKKSGAQITAVACYGEKIEAGSVSVKSVLKGKTADTSLVPKFTVTNVVGNIYSISADVAVPKGNYNLVLQGKLAGSAADAALTEFEPLAVKVIETKPTVSIKQTKKVNLFYTYNSNSGRGTLKPSCKLAGVTLTQKDTTSDFKLSADGKTGNYKVSLKKEAEGKKNPVKKMTVVASFSGYKSEYDKEIIVNVATEDKAPKLVLEVDDKILYTQLGVNDTEMRILDKDTNTYVSGANVVLAKSTEAYKKANASFTLDEENGVYTLGASKSGSAKISVKDADWMKEVILSQPITVNTKAPKVTFAVAKLNSADAYATLEQASALITLKNAKNFKVRDLKLDSKNASAKELLDYLDYKVIVDEEGRNLLEVSLNKKLPTKANGKCQYSGNYTFTASFKLNRLAQTASVKVNISDKATVTTSQKGSIDLVNRSGSSVTVKPVLKNLNGTVIDMYLKDDASNQFEVKWDSEKSASVVKAREWIDMKKGGKYKVTPVFVVQLENGVVELEAKTITISPKSSTVKTTTILPMETRLSAPSVTATAAVKAKSPAAAEILGMTQMNYLDKFTVEYDAQSDTLFVQLADTTGLKAGSTYKVTMMLDIKDAGVNVKKQTIMVPVKVLK